MTTFRKPVDAHLFEDLLGPTDGVAAVKTSFPPSTTAEIARNRPEKIREADLAALWGVSSRQVRTLVTERVIEKESGLFDFGECTRRYIERLIYQASRRGGSDPELRAERLRVQRETADKLAMGNALLRGELVSVVTVEKEWSGILRTVRAGMLAVPSRIGGKLSLSAHDLDLIDREIREALTEIGNG